MKVFLDACVLYPTVMREVLLGVARAGLFEPLWSERVLEEWARAAGRHGQEEIARGEIALARAAWPQAEVPPGPEAGLWLPDPNDVHVLAAARSAGADGILTLNLKDFPRRVLGEAGLALLEPDGFLLGLWGEAPGAVTEVAKEVRAEAERLSGEAWALRRLLKKARLPRLGKALAGEGQSK